MSSTFFLRSSTPSNLGIKLTSVRQNTRLCQIVHNGLNGAGDRVGESLNSRITITRGLRSGQPCIRDLRITVWDILKWLGNAASHAQIIRDYPEFMEEDILAALQWAAALKDNTVVR